MEHQMNLFNTTPEKSGYRLQYMEILNWGTFDKEIYRICPQGNNSLLTGANASGKSTLVDALLTLLVPMKRNRFYNQSSGAEKKGARTEESYVLGYHGTQQEEGGTGTTTLKLRDKSTRSVLLASFRNAEGEYITLFQVRYFSGQELRTVYGIAKIALKIKDDFSDFDVHGEWRKRLDRKYNSKSVKKIISFYNGPSEYAAQICERFHMRSQNALTLFNQIVGVKVLDDLDLFIRHHMLDELPAEEKYNDLYSNFQNLMGAKNNIDKTQEQIRLLQPINEVARKLQDIEQEIKKLEESKETAAYWFAARIVMLAEEQKNTNRSERRKKKEKLTYQEDQTKRVEQQIIKLEIAIANDEISKRIAELVHQIQELTEKREKRSAKAKEYDRLAQQLAFTCQPSKDDFDKNQASAEIKRRKKEEELNGLAESYRKWKNLEEDIDKQIQEDIVRIQGMEKNKNNISGRVSEIRNEILQAVGATPTEIPFIGELIRVKNDERDWEASIERILHNFALRLIVPEKYYQSVNEYVNSHNLNGRIVYQRYQDFTSIKEMEKWEMADNQLLQKIEFKPDNQYVEWLENEIYQRYNYTCVNNLEEFNRQHEKAVTQEGLIKSVRNKHEKDDRKEIRSRDNYVLGWENKDKIAFLRQEVRRLQEEQKTTQSEIRTIEKQQRECNLQINRLNELLNRFEDYESIDWTSCAQSILELEKQKKKFEEADNKAKALREELEVWKLKKKNLEEETSQLKLEIHDLDKELEELTEQYQTNLTSLHQMGIVNVDYFEQQHPDLLNVPIKKLEAKRSDFQTSISQSLSRKNKGKNDLKLKAIRFINEFKRPAQEITDKYKDWNSDVNSLPNPDNIDLIEEYQTYYNRLVEEDLISYQKAFNDYLQENIYTNVNLYKHFFDQWETEIRKAIEQLNASLKDIVFNKDQGTYIQLTATKAPSAEVKDFLRMLLQANPNLHEVGATVDGRQRHFETYIEPLMERLEDEVWRSKVTDVRTWFTYRAEEFYLESGQRCKTYESMGQLSGGEKAQLTYTILGSAIAYQFGFTKSGLETSFRFIAIDEAFKAQDEDKARYLLDLCSQLHLQLLMVTPSDNIHIVENSISFVHYVERKGETSVLYNLPIIEYQREYKKAERHD
ncbi:hypothetical protein EVA_19930 [gut metagenome]|uniref:Uncharacterized protein n=1 Tax=gut metagenome TaxID=749906 RepID=J9FAP0_9ZZZZ